jgi:dihydrofolate synthase/folylpolyglutamate synthase
MTYRETLNYLFEQLPMFQRVGAAAYKADLSNTISLCKLIGNPEKSLRFVHIAGTNGKGSTAHMTASVLQEAGYKTGLFTSPHLKDFRERIKINGELMDEEAVIEFVELFKNGWQSIKPSFFEITAAMAFWYFRQEQVDIVVLETGMGGRLDSTNVVRPEVSVITSIGMDHMQFLGDTIEKIAGEKAGIIKPATPVVTGLVVPEALEVIRAKARDVKAPLTESTALERALPPLDLKGPFQPINARTAICTIDVLRKKGYTISDEQLSAGLGNVVANTGLMGRWQVLSERPLTVTDCAHNAHALEGILQEVARQDYHNLHIVLGFANDKDISGILKLFPREATYYFAAAKVPRALAADQLMEQAAAFGLQGEAFSSVRKAYEAARLYATRRDMIYIGGSVFVVAEVV